MIGMIASVNHQWVIGRKDGSIPWQHKGDQQLFRYITMGTVVIMGRVTWDGIPLKYRPLHGRHNCVISTTLLAVPGADVVMSVGQAVDDYRGVDIWFIGGERIYREALPFCDTVHLTVVPDIVAGDDLVYFPLSCRDLCDTDGWIGKKVTHPYNQELKIVEYNKI